MPCPNYTRLLEAVQQGDPRAAADLLPLVYDELRKLAATKMADEPPGHTLDATGWSTRLTCGWSAISSSTAGGTSSLPRPRPCAASWSIRPFAESAKRGGKRVRMELLDQAGSLAEDPDLILSLDELLTRLGEEDASRRTGCAPASVRRHLGRGSGRRSLELSRPVAYRNWKYAAGLASRGAGKIIRERETLSPRMGALRADPILEVPMAVDPARVEIPVPGRCRPRRSGRACRLPGPRVRAETPNSATESRRCCGPTMPLRCHQPERGSHREPCPRGSAAAARSGHPAARTGRHGHRRQIHADRADRRGRHG